MSITIRPARAADKDSVLAFTRHTWDWGDYIPEAWDAWLGDARGELTVAELDGQPVAMAMCSLASANEGWLQGLRVHPDFRRHGIAMQLTTYQLDWLRRRGATVGRLAVFVTNAASQSLVARMGFRHVTTFGEREQPAAAPQETGTRAVTLGEADAPGAWAWLTASPTWQAAAGLWANGWTWQRLTYDALADQARRGNVLGVRSAGGWGALAVALLDHDGQHIGYADGAGEAIAELARALSTRGWQAKEQHNLALLPPVQALEAAFEQAGYAPETGGSAMLIYALDL